MNIAETILLFAVPGLMFCIIPVSGMEFRLSWQLVSLWLGGVAFTAFLSSWWWRAFFLLALIRTATMAPAYDAYISLVTIAVFLAAAEGFSRIDSERVMNAMCVAALLLFVCALLLKTVIRTTWIGPAGLVGPFNPNSFGVFFALCLPAFLRPRWWPFGAVCLIGMVMAGATTAAIAAAAGLGAFLFIRWADHPRRIVAGAAALVMLLGVWAWRVDSLESTIRGERWIAWKHATWSMRSEILGRGLGSWKTVFPLLASGEKNWLAQVKNENGKITLIHTFQEAHNEYIQATFELGVQAALLMVLFTGFMGWEIFTRHAPAHTAAGMATLMVASLGFFVFHEAPLALLGCAWLGQWKRRARI